MRPYVVVNVAMSADGKLSTRERRQVKISGKDDFARVDRLKAGSDAVMVGIGTVLADDPSLTVKSSMLKEERVLSGRAEHPIRVVVDSTARIPLDAAILHKGEGLRVIACSKKADEEKLKRLEEYATIIIAGGAEVDLTKVLESLADMGIRRLMVEGGGTLIWSLIAEGLVDEIYCFIGSIIIGGRNAPTLSDGIGFVSQESFTRLKLLDLARLDDGVLVHWQVRPGEDGP